MNLREALQISLEYENKVRDHYKMGVGKITDPVGRRIFTTLAEEEQNHVDFLENRLARLNDPNVEPITFGTVVPPEWVEAAKRKLEKPPSDKIANQTDIELVKLALELEHETSNFYRSLMDKLESEEDKKFFEPFIEIEDGHISIVQAELDALQGIGFWFDFKEFSLEAG